MPAMFLLPDEVAWSVAALFLLLAAVRAVQGCQVLRYRWNLRLQRRYLEHAGGFSPPRFLDRSPPGADPLWIVIAERQL